MREWPRLNPHRQRHVERLRFAGLSVLAACIGLAIVVYRLGVVNHEPTVQELLPGTAASIERQRGILFGRAGAAIMGWFDLLWQPAGQAAREEFNRIFSQREIPTDIEVRTMERGTGPVRLIKLLPMLGLAPSVSEAQRLIESGAVHLNEERVTSIKAELDISQPFGATFKVGKRRFLRLVVS